MRRTIWSAMMVAGLYGAPAAAQTGAVEGLFLDVPVGLRMPVSEASNEGLYDVSFATGVGVAYLFGLPGGGAGIGPEVVTSYSPGNVDSDVHGGDWDEGDLYLGRFLATGGVRLQLAFGQAFLLARLGVGIDYVHASWDSVVYDRDDDESDVAVGLLAGAGLGVMLTDLIGLVMQLNLPMGFHDDDPDHVPVEWFEMVDIEASAAVTFHLL